MINFHELSTEDLFKLMQQLEGHIGHRQTVDALEKQINEVIDTARKDGSARTPEPGEEFRYPRDVTEAYKAGETVVDEGTYYRSLITPNLCHPKRCDTGWEETEAPDDEDAEDRDEAAGTVSRGRNRPAAEDTEGGG